MTGELFQTQRLEWKQERGTRNISWGEGQEFCLFQRVVHIYNARRCNKHYNTHLLPSAVNTGFDEDGSITRATNFLT